MEIVRDLLSSRNEGRNEGRNEADVNNNAWGQFVLMRHQPEEIMSRMKCMRYPRPKHNNDRLLSLTTHAFEPAKNDDQMETSVRLRAEYLLKSKEFVP